MARNLSSFRPTMRKSDGITRHNANTLHDQAEDALIKELAARYSCNYTEFVRYAVRYVLDHINHRELEQYVMEEKDLRDKRKYDADDEKLASRRLKI